MAHHLNSRSSKRIFTRNAVKQKTLNQIDRFNFRGGIRL